MSRTVGSLSTHYTGECTTLAMCVKFKRVDGTVFGITETDQTLSVDLSDGDGSVDYKPDNAFNRSTIATESNLKVSTVDIDVLYDSSNIKEDEVRRGLFDAATVVVFEVDWTSPGTGQNVLFKGNVGEITLHDNFWSAKLRSLEGKLQQANVVKAYQLACPFTLGDSDCGVVLSPSAWAADQDYTAFESGDAKVGDIIVATTYDNRFYLCTRSGFGGDVEPTWDTTLGNTTTASASSGSPSEVTAQFKTLQGRYRNGTVASVTDNREFVSTGVTVEKGFFVFGKVTWLTGDNAGTTQDVGSDDGVGTLVLLEEPPFDISAGDTFRVTTGCMRDLFDCRDKFDNIKNHGGFPFAPTTSVLAAYPASNQEENTNLTYSEFYADSANSLREQIKSQI